MKAYGLAYNSKPCTHQVTLMRQELVSLIIKPEETKRV